MQTKILFVDDEPNILSGLRRQLRSRSNDWAMEFAPGGAQALELLQKQEFEVIVTDMRMPGIDGAELLARVRANWPGMIRIVLSGHSEREHVMRSVHEAHQYLAKPCEASALQSAIDRAIRLRLLIRDQRLAEVVSQLDHLPSLPSLYMEITNAVRNDKLTLAEIGRIVEKDIAVSAKILQIVNSAFFALPRHISSPSEAAVLLGLDVLRALVLGSKLFSAFEADEATRQCLDELWHHGQRVAILARSIACDLGLNQTHCDKAFMGGLLHDIGKLVLLTHRSADALGWLDESSGGSDLRERDLFHATHGVVGAYLLGVWGLPDDIVAAVAYHHHPEFDAVIQRDAVAAVHLAVCLEQGSRPASELLEAIDASTVFERQQSLISARPQQ